jgi:tetraacyldisaccharide 4'-kinase
VLKFFQLLFLPLSLIYQLILRFRNYLYDSGVFGVTSFDIPSIGLGNLAFGGTGKTPHIEYLIQLLSKEKKVAVLSRGYRRKTSGYLLANAQSTPFTLGDEPYQMFSKFPQINVAVSENRVLGIPNLLMDVPETDIILLDDIYQHRGVLPGINILLSEQNKLYTDDQLVPSGYLREYPSAAKRADIIIVTKCNPELSLEERVRIRQKLQPLAHQKVFFSYLQYAELIPYFERKTDVQADTVLAFSGIANPEKFEAYLQSQFPVVLRQSFPDHHALKEQELNQLLYTFEEIKSLNKIIVSTEKDYQKLAQSEFAHKIKDLPIFYLPVRVEFFPEDKSIFDQIILQYVTKN